MIDSYNYHKKIFDNIKNKNTTEAVNSVKEHLEFVKKNFEIISRDENPGKSPMSLVDDKI
jgi:DNA-binding FadR family transcriptional regulator